MHALVGLRAVDRVSCPLSQLGGVTETGVPSSYLKSRVNDRCTTSASMAVAPPCALSTAGLLSAPMEKMHFPLGWSLVPGDLAPSSNGKG